jgi:DNA-binding CsgD family transcriptional regulator/predicted enzyme related to lactoylglutathione lyase
MKRILPRGRGRPRHDDVLTPGEWRMVHAVQHGMTSREIAERRGISRDAVKFHVTNVIAKLGLPHLYTYGTLAFFDCGGVRLLLSQVETKPAPESIVYLRVADIQSAYEELKARGVDFTNAPHMIHRHADGTEEWMAFFNDPEGRPLAIMSQAE